MSVLLRIAYDGTELSGFSRQADRADGRPVRTVQGEIESALSRLFDGAITVRGASRTDAGVHARGQLVAFEAPRAIPPHGIAAFLRDALPPDVAVTAAWEEPGEVDPRRGNLGKHYRYRIRCTRHRDVHDARFTWQLARPLDPEAMQQAAWRLVGTHDFAAFRAARCHALSTERTLHAVDVRWFSDPDPGPDDPGRTDAVHSDRDLVQVDVSGTAFLYKMVRIIVGTLVEVGIGRWPVTRIDEILARADRTLAGPTAPPHGLTLMEVRWPGRTEGRHRESDQTDLLSS